MSKDQKACNSQSGFDRDGFAVYQGFLNRNELRELVRQIDRYVREVAPGLPAHEKFYEDKSDPDTLQRLERMDTHDGYFRELIASDHYTVVGRRTLGEEVVPKRVAFFNKPARVGNLTPPHQDGYYFMIQPNWAVTFWLAIDPSSGNRQVRPTESAQRSSGSGLPHRDG